jgi:protein TonB
MSRSARITLALLFVGSAMTAMAGCSGGGMMDLGCTSDGAVMDGPSVEGPQIIQETKIPPEYPEPARLELVEGSVLLQVVIGRNGTVCEPQVLEVDEPGYGFEEASIEAVSQWRYRPARVDGVPVNLFTTIYVEYTLQLPPGAAEE